MFARKILFSFYFLLFIFLCKWIKCAYWIQFLWWKKIFASQYILECIKRRMRDISYVEHRMRVKADPSCTVLYIRCNLKFDRKKKYFLSSLDFICWIWWAIKIYKTTLVTWKSLVIIIHLTLWNPKLWLLCTHCRKKIGKYELFVDRVFCFLGQRK